MSKLTLRQERFCEEYLRDSNATQAAVRAGYSPSTARQQGHRLLTHVDIAARIKSGRECLAAQAHVDALGLIIWLRDLASTSMADFIRLDDDGQPLVDLSATTAAQRGAISEIQIDTFVEGSGESARTVTRVKIKPYSRLDAIDKLAKHLGFYERNRGQSIAGEMRAWLQGIQPRAGSMPIDGT